MSQFNFIGNFLGKEAKPSKDGHDMSCQYAYSSNFGTFNVVDVIDVVPNEHYRCNYSGYVQTAPMREDNFAMIRNNMKAVFVPRTSMQRNYFNLLGNRETRKNLQFDYPACKFTIPMYNFLCYLFPSYFICKLYEDLCATVDDVYNVYFCSYGSEPIRFRSIDYASPLNEKSILAVPYNGDYPVAACWRLLQLIFTESGVENDTLSIGSWFDEMIRECRSRSGNAICFDGLRLLDSFGYGNFAPVFDSYYKYILSQGDTQRDFDNDYITLEEVTYLEYGYSFMFGHFFFELPFFDQTHQRTTRVNPFHLYEFQFYLSMCERSNYRSPSVDVVTLDSIQSNFGDLPLRSHYEFLGGDGVRTCNQRAIDWLNLVPPLGYTHFSSFVLRFSGNYSSEGQRTLFYNCDEWDTDFMSHLIAFDHLGCELKYLLQSSNPLLDSDIFTTMQNSVVSGQVPTVGAPISVQDLNDLSAAYKLKQDLLRAGVRRDKQMKSIFGVGVDDLLQDIYILDQSSSLINIQGLLNQAETEVAELGERGARGNGSSGLSFEFDSKDYGTIIVVQSFTTEAFYENFKIHKLNRINFDNDWLPMMNNLGLEAVRALDCSYQPSIYAEDYNDLIKNINTQSFGNKVLGYSARYYERKQRVSCVRGLFTNFGFAENPSLDDSTKSPWRKNFALVRGNGAFGGYVPTVINQQSDLFSTENDLYFNPFMVNNLFTTMNDGAAHGSFEYDQFRCFLTCSVHKVSPMPKVGLLKMI